MENYKGYEVSYIEHSFTIAFSTIEDVSNFCIATQIALLNVSWPPEILNEPAYVKTNLFIIIHKHSLINYFSGKAVYQDGGLMWKGLRVKMAVVSGVPNCAIDPSSGRMAYVCSHSCNPNNYSKININIVWPCSG